MAAFHTNDFGSAYLVGSIGAEVSEKISAFHQFQDEEAPIVIQADPQQLKNVFVFEIAHESGFLEELCLLHFRRPLPKSLPKHIFNF